MSNELGPNTGQEFTAPQQLNQAEAVRKVIKTPMMQKVEQHFGLPGEHIWDVLKRMHVDENKNLTVIVSEFSTGENIHVGGTTIRRWMRQLHPEIEIKHVRPSSDFMKQKWEDPQFRKPLSAKHATFWSKPENKKRMLEQIHSEDAKTKRKATIRKNNPSRMHQVAETRHRKSLEAKLVALGPKPEATLRKMARAKLNGRQIAEKVGVNKTTIYSWLRDYGIKLESPSPISRNRSDIDAHQFSIRRSLIKESLRTGEFVQLTNKEQEVLSALYLQKGKPTQAEIARVLGKKRQAVSQMENKALGKLTKLKEQGADTPLLTEEKVYELYMNQGYSESKVAFLLGSTRYAVRVILGRLNVEK